MKKDKEIQPLKLGRKSDTQQRIVQILKQKPSTLSELAVKLVKAPSTIYYHLHELMKRNVIAVTKEKLYKIAEESEIELIILNILKGRILTEDDIISSNDLKHFKNTEINNAIQKLIFQGLIEKDISKSFFEKKDFLTLSYRGAEKLKVCYKCGKEISNGVFVGASVFEDMGGAEGYTYTMFHPECLREKIELHPDIGFDNKSFCNFCGLPLSPEMLRQVCYPPYFDELSRFLTITEKQIIDELIKERKINHYNLNIWWKLEEVEFVISNIAKKAKEKKINYNEEERIKELWKIISSLKTMKEEVYLKAILQLTGPVGFFYSLIMPSISAQFSEIMETKTVASSDKSKEGKIEKTKLDVRSEGKDCFFFIKEGDKKFHPYCFLVQEKIKQDHDGMKQKNGGEED